MIVLTETSQSNCESDVPPPKRPNTRQTKARQHPFQSCHISASVNSDSSLSSPPSPYSVDQNRHQSGLAIKSYSQQHVTTMPCSEPTHLPPTSSSQSLHQMSTILGEQQGHEYSARSSPLPMDSHYERMMGTVTLPIIHALGMEFARVIGMKNK